MAGAKYMFVLIWIDMAKLPSMGPVAVYLAISNAGE